MGVRLQAVGSPSCIRSGRLKVAYALSTLYSPPPPPSPLGFDLKAKTSGGCRTVVLLPLQLRVTAFQTQQSRLLETLQLVLVAALHNIGSHARF